MDPYGCGVGGNSQKTTHVGNKSSTNQRVTAGTSIDLTLRRIR